MKNAEKSKGHRASDKYDSDTQRAARLAAADAGNPAMQALWQEVERQLAATEGDNALVQPRKTRDH